MTDYSKVSAFMTKMLRERNDEAPLCESESLFGKGRLDSLAAVNLVVFLEQEFGMNFADIGLDLERIDSVDLIVKLVRESASAQA